jgi:hypothetical protein
MFLGEDHGAHPHDPPFLEIWRIEIKLPNQSFRIQIAWA